MVYVVGFTTGNSDLLILSPYMMPSYAIRIGLKMTMEKSLFPSIYTDLYMNFNEFHTPTGLSQARLPGSFSLVAADLSPLCICGLWQKLRGETETTSRRQ